MTDKLTFGNTRLKLESMGYIAAATSGSQSHRAADEPAAILLSNVGALTVAVCDTKGRADILQVFKNHGLSKTPCRVNTAGALTFIFALPAYEPPHSRQSKPFYREPDAAVSLDTFAMDAVARRIERYTVALNGEWRDGSPLTVERGDLPAVNLDALFDEVEDIVRSSEPAYEQPALPSEMQAKIAAQRKKLEAQKAEIAKRTDESIWAVVDAAVRSVKTRGIGATPLDQANAIIQAESHESRIAHYDQIVAERAEAASRKKKLG